MRWRAAVDPGVFLEVLTQIYSLTLTLSSREGTAAGKAPGTYGKKLNYMASGQELEEQLSLGQKCCQVSLFLCGEPPPHTACWQRQVPKPEFPFIWLTLFLLHSDDFLGPHSTQFKCQPEIFQRLIHTNCQPVLGTTLPGFRIFNPPWLRLSKRPWDHMLLRRQNLSPWQGHHLCPLLLYPSWTRAYDWLDNDG